MRSVTPVSGPRPSTTGCPSGSATGPARPRSSARIAAGAEPEPEPGRQPEPEPELPAPHGARRHFRSEPRPSVLFPPFLSLHSPLSSLQPRPLPIWAKPRLFWRLQGDFRSCYAAASGGLSATAPPGGGGPGGSSQGGWANWRGLGRTGRGLGGTGKDCGDPGEVWGALGGTGRGKWGRTGRALEATERDWFELGEGSWILGPPGPP